MIRVIAIITAKPGRREDILTAFREIVPDVLAERGCLEYQPTVDTQGASPARMGADAIVVIETWESAEALEAHRVAPHMAAFGKKTRESIASAAVHVLSPAAS
jgi:quinol monooxygenase YgiN